MALLVWDRLTLLWDIEHCVVMMNATTAKETETMSPTRKVTIWIRGDLVTVTIPFTSPRLDEWGNETYPIR